MLNETTTTTTTTTNEMPAGTPIDCPICHKQCSGSTGLRTHTRWAHGSPAQKRRMHNSVTLGARTKRRKLRKRNRDNLLLQFRNGEAETDTTATKRKITAKPKPKRGGKRGPKRIPRGVASAMESLLPATGNRVVVCPRCRCNILAVEKVMDFREDII